MLKFSINKVNYQWRREGLWRPGQTFVLPPLLARGPSRLGVWGAPQRAYGVEPRQNMNLVHFKRHRTLLVDGY